MLTPEYYEHCTDDIIELYGELDNAITRDIVRRIVKTGTITETAKQQIMSLQHSGKLYDDVIKTIAKFLGKSENQTRRMFKDAGVTSVDYDNDIYIKQGLNALPLNMSPQALNVLSAGLTKTNGFLHNLTKTTALQAQQAYIKAITLAEIQIESGAFDYATAIKNAVKSVIDEGATVKYPSGHIDRLEVAVRRAVLTGVSQTVGEISVAHANDMGCDLMEITAHYGARPSHAEWQGKLVSLSGKKGYLTISDIGYGTGAGFKGWNCRHDWHPFFDDSVRAYTDEQLKDYKDKTVTYNGKEMTVYESTQRQRAMERDIRKSKRELAGYDEAIKHADDNDALKKDFQTSFERTSVKLKQQEAKYKEFSYAVNQRPDNIRTQVQGFDKSVSQKAVWANKKAVAKSTESDIIDVTEGGKYKTLRNEDEYKALANSQNITKEQSKQIWSRDDGKLGYIQAQHNYGNINGYLRGQIKTLTPDNQKTVDTLDKLTSTNVLPDNHIGIRKVSESYLPDVLGIKSFDKSDKKSVSETIDAIRKISGTEIEDKAFTSISLLEDKNYFTGYPIKFTIKMPKGMKGLVTNNVDESEFISARSSKLKIINAETYKPKPNSKKTYINIIAEMMQ